MAIKKSEIYSDLWKNCIQFRGKMDPSEYKDYILSILFVKYVSDKIGKIKDSPITVPEGGSFADMVLLKGKPEIGKGINDVIEKLAEENNLKGVIDIADFNDPEKVGSGKTMVDTLSNVISIFQNSELDFSKNKADDDDLIGDAYEFLMRKFAIESGKSKGQFYTPSEVSKIIAKVIGSSSFTKKSDTVYDPTCGSGSLLLKVASETPNGISIYGQESIKATSAMAIMNMWIHNNAEAEIANENTISEPQFLNDDGSLRTFDLVVANPPFSDRSWVNGIDKNIGKVDNFFSLSPIVMYLPIKLQDTILKKLIKRASVITIIESLTKLS